MEYMILIHSDESYAMPEPGEQGFDEAMAAWMVFNQKLIDGGHWIAGANLEPTTTATTIHKVPGGAPTLTDGPYAETKEQLGGFYLVKAADLDEALALASSLPLPAASIEVRPVKVRPDAA
ncbi:YciI family protein [Microbacterium marmarense]|uniref:YciI family protein n=1 Tax=Microbacterium marmarense TaxID=3122051 RepID=A0ABU8LWX5_9MICO